MLHMFKIKFKHFSPRNLLTGNQGNLEAIILKKKVLILLLFKLLRRSLVKESLKLRAFDRQSAIFDK